MNIRQRLVVVFLLASAFVLYPNYDLTIPAYFPALKYPLKQNPLQSEAIQLGRLLFYDPMLSADSSTSCASCHSSYNAFAHTDHKLSHGIGDRVGNRNAPALFNLGWQPLFMWDGAHRNLDMQALAPISHPKEMGFSIVGVVQRLQGTLQYRGQFYRAYGDSVVTGEKVLKALAQFQLTLISAGSKYDKVRQGQTAFTEQEAKGYKLFLKHCNTCHTEPLFSNYRLVSNGLPPDPVLQDSGRMGITGKEEDRYRFKTPSLRNLSYTFPYMHDGRFQTLSAVLNHYSNGISEAAKPDHPIRGPLLLSGAEKVELISFLRTLNDSAFVFNKAHAFPMDLRTFWKK
jgi:cytochrome c peroxidase